MPHVIGKLWPGKSEDQKQKLADEISQSVQSVLGYGEESVSVAMLEVSSSDWKREVFDPEIAHTNATLYKMPGYRM